MSAALKKISMVLVGILALVAYLIVGLILFVPVVGAMAGELIFDVDILPRRLREFIL